MKAIWRIPLIRGPGLLAAELHEGYEVVHVANKRADGQPSMWVLLDPHRPPIRVMFEIVATGEAFLPVRRYVGTYMLDGGTLVFHVLDAGEE